MQRTLLTALSLCLGAVTVSVCAGAEDADWDFGRATGSTASGSSSRASTPHLASTTPHPHKSSSANPSTTPHVGKSTPIIAHSSSTPHASTKPHTSKKPTLSTSAHTTRHTATVPTKHPTRPTHRTTHKSRTSTHGPHPPATHTTTVSVRPPITPSPRPPSTDGSPDKIVRIPSGYTCRGEMLVKVSVTSDHGGLRFGMCGGTSCKVVHLAGLKYGKLDGWVVTRCLTNSPVDCPYPKADTELDYSWPLGDLYFTVEISAGRLSLWMEGEGQREEKITTVLSPGEDELKLWSTIGTVALQNPRHGGLTDGYPMTVGQRVLLLFNVTTDRDLRISMCDAADCALVYVYGVQKGAMGYRILTTQTNDPYSKMAQIIQNDNGPYNLNPGRYFLFEVYRAEADKTLVWLSADPSRKAQLMGSRSELRVRSDAGNVDLFVKGRADFGECQETRGNVLSTSKGPYYL